MIRHTRVLAASGCQRPNTRRGIFMVLSAFCLVVVLAFVSLAVDVGYLSLTKQRMQNGVDAAALAAAMEITAAVHGAGPDVANVTQYAEQRARLKAQEVAALNGIYVNPNRDVVFGQRLSTDNGATWTIQWNVSPYNVVKVNAHRDKDDPAAPDTKLKLFFGGIVGNKSTSLVTTAAAYVESRDIACVLDFSASMNDDSAYVALGRRDRTALEANMREIYDILKVGKNFGDLEFEPDYLTVTTSSGSINGSTIFRNKQIDLSTSQPLKTVRLTYSDGSSNTFNITGSNVTSGTWPTNAGSKSIDQVLATVQYESWGSTQTASGSSGGRNASVTFNANSTVRVTSSQTMSQVRFVYYPSGTSTSNVSGTSANLTGQNQYISQIQVKIGNNWVTVNNPNGSQPQMVTQNLTFTDNATAVKNHFSLNGSFPWPGDTNWNNFVSYCRTNASIESAGYTRMYGGKQLVSYLLDSRPSYTQTPDLWKTPHYPFHSLKQGATLFADFLEGLGFGDEIGFVSYDTYARREDRLNQNGFNINMSGNPVNNQFGNFRQLVRHKQAGHYYQTTNIGGGILEARLMLDESARPGTRPTILLITDGLPNVRDSAVNLPGSWNWNTLFDYNGDGVADYTTSDVNARYALIMAKQAVDAGYTIHTMSVGGDADASLMKAIAWMGRGISFSIPGDSSVAEMESEILEAFNRIAAFVPPAKLVSDF